MKNYARIAMVCHEANRAYCKALGDDSQPAWFDAPDWQKESAIKGVLFKEAMPESGPEDSHNSWLLEKQNQGWVYGEEKNADKKTHPCMVSYDELPLDQRAKDHIFQAIAGTMLMMEEPREGSKRADDRYDLLRADSLQQ